MKVSELGEFGLINLLAKMVQGMPGGGSGNQPQLILGIGDDAAAWQGDTSIQLATVDALIQGVHFPQNTSSWAGLGWRAMAANLSDIAAMGGVPKYALVSLALPGEFEVENVTALYQGMIDLAQHFAVIIAGGDTCRAPQVVINITVLGSTQRQDNNLLTRSAARPGDKVAVTGNLGGAATGLEMITKGLQFDAEASTSLQEAFLHPFPRVTEGQILLEQGVRAAIDISDGLISDLNHICQASRVSARIEVDRVPVHPAVKANFGEKALELALSGGEDYELLFTAGAEVIERVKAAVSCPITVIGEIVSGETGKITLVDGRGNPVVLSRTGWEHFSA